MRKLTLLAVGWCFLTSLACANVVVNGPVDYPGLGPNVLNNGNSTTLPSNSGSSTLLCYTVTADDITAGSVFLQFEVNEDNSATVNLDIAFSVINVAPSDGDAVTNVIGTDDSPTGDASYTNPAFGGGGNQSLYEWAVPTTDLEVGDQVCADFTVSDQTNGAELARWSPGTLAAIPEPSAFLAVALAFLGVSGGRVGIRWMGGKAESQS